MLGRPGKNPFFAQEELYAKTHPQAVVFHCACRVDSGRIFHCLRRRLDAGRTRRPAHRLHLRKPPGQHSWTYAWGWNGPNSSTGTTNQHLYNAPSEARIVTGGSYVFCPAGANGLYAINKSNGAQAWQFTTATVNATPGL